jgi:hypothetical protein
MTIRQRFNLSMFNLGYTIKGKILRTIPSILIPKSGSAHRELNIAITTYVDRYDLFFKPLYHTLRKLFPHINFYIAVNGFHDKVVQEHYLRRFYNEICTKRLIGEKFILHDRPVGLTRLWNELISEGTCQTTLVLNDDLRIYPWFRKWIERRLWSSSITLINGTWSHFFICRNLFDTVGSFDEDFRGIGFEDMDYTARCAYNKVSINNVKCQFINHLDHQPSRTSFDDQSSTLWGPKYSSINHEVFFRKWKVCDYDSGAYIKQLDSYVMPVKGFDKKQSKINLKFINGVCYPDRAEFKS